MKSTFLDHTFQTINQYCNIGRCNTENPACSCNALIRIFLLRKGKEFCTKRDMHAYALIVLAKLCTLVSLDGSIKFAMNLNYEPYAAHYRENEMTNVTLTWTYYYVRKCAIANIRKIYKIFRIKHPLIQFSVIFIFLNDILA